MSLLWGLINCMPWFVLKYPYRTSRSYAGSVTQFCPNWNGFIGIVDPDWDKIPVKPGPFTNQSLDVRQEQVWRTYFVLSKSQSKWLGSPEECQLVKQREVRQALAKATFLMLWWSQFEVNGKPKHQAIGWRNWGDSRERILTIVLHNAQYVYWKREPLLSANFQAALDKKRNRQSKESTSPRVASQSNPCVLIKCIQDYGQGQKVPDTPREAAWPLQLCCGQSHQKLQKDSQQIG